MHCMTRISQQECRGILEFCLPEGGDNLEPGTWLDGRYKILRFLGKGSEGSVYLAFHEKLFRFYAVKELNKEGLCFSRESIEVWKTLRCSGLPEIVDILENEEMVWIVTEYIEGETLAEYMKKGRRLSVEKAASWCIQIEHVLTWLHSQDPPVFYGDLKPDNLIVQKERIILVDMGSLIRRGSRGKRIGTPEYRRGELFQDETEDDYSFGKLMEILGEYCQSRKMRKLADQMMKSKKGSEKKKRKKIRNTLRLIQNQKRIQIGLFLVTVGILIKAGVLGSEQIRQNWIRDQYESELADARLLNGRKKQETLKKLILAYPERAEGYLELLYTFQEDALLDEEEAREYRKIWKKIPEGWQENLEQILQKNPEEYQKVAYESGITCWYYDQSTRGKKDAAQWFQKVTKIPEEVCGDTELYEKSILYGKLGQNREKWKKYDETGENDGLFLLYWEDQKQLLEKQGDQIGMTRLMLWKETLAVWKHYMVELKETGIGQKEEEELLEKMNSELEQVPEQHRRMQEIKDRLLADEQEVREMMRRVYQM